MKQTSQALALDGAKCPGSLPETTFSLKFKMVTEITFMSSDAKEWVVEMYCRR